MSTQKTNQDKNAHSSEKTARGSKSVHSKLDDSTQNGWEPPKKSEEE